MGGKPNLLTQRINNGPWKSSGQKNGGCKYDDYCGKILQVRNVQYMKALWTIKRLLVLTQCVYIAANLKYYH